MKTSIDKAWDYSWDRLFCNKTNLFYDYTVSEQPDGNISSLPSPELINAGVPNPCGWSTGMEDSVLNGGSMLDAVIARYNVTSDSAMKEYADRIFAGMMLCVNVSGREGYLPRSVSPVDMKSHYTNSSRDQYTHFVYSALRFFDSPLSDEAQKNDIKRALSFFARGLDRDVTPENGYNILREDGKPGLVCEMWGNLSVHEWLRMPMIYAAAWYVTGDKHFFDMYMKYRDEAYDGSAVFNRIQGDTYTALQMMYSVRALYITDPEEAFRKRLSELLEKISLSVKNVAADRLKRICDPEYSHFIGYSYLAWDKVRARYYGFAGDKMYYVPSQYRTPENPSFLDIREVGEAVAIGALVPDGKGVSKADAELLEKTAGAIDYSKHASYAPLLLVNGYWLAKEALAGI